MSTQNKFAVGDKVKLLVNKDHHKAGECFTVTPENPTEGFWLRAGEAEYPHINDCPHHFELVEAAQESNETPSLVQKTTPKNDDSSAEDSQPSISNNDWFERGELPPIRTECILVRNSDCVSDGNRCVVLYIGSIYAIVDEGFGEQHYYLKNIDFRPIKTIEEIEAEGREKAIEELRSSVGEKLGIKPCSALQWRVAEAIYDLGYRKMEKTND